MKIINFVCLALLILSVGCTNKGERGTAADIRSEDEEAITKCNHYRTCYQKDMYYTSTCMKWNTQWSKERMPQLQRVSLLQKCYLDKDKIRDECFGTDSKEVRLLKIEECKQIGIDPTKPNNK
jgi:hypothetical protein